MILVLWIAAFSHPKPSHIEDASLRELIAEQANELEKQATAHLRSRRHA
jgi:hypothetical protein